MDYSYLSGLYGFDVSQLADLVRVEDETIGGHESIHLKGEFARPFPPYLEQLNRAYAECGIATPKSDSGSEFMHSLFPDKEMGTFEAWIGSEDFYIYRLEIESEVLKGERIIHSERTESTYSLFNEAELPGPFPTTAASR